MFQRRMKLVGELVARSTHSATVRAAALNHELRNHAMKNQTVVERPLFFLSRLFIGEFFCAFSESNEIRNGLGRFLLEQPHNNIPLRSLKNSVGSCRSAHAFSLRNNSSYTSRSWQRHF